MLFIVWIQIMDDAEIPVFVCFPASPIFLHAESLIQNCIIYWSKLSKWQQETLHCYNFIISKAKNYFSCLCIFNARCIVETVYIKAFICHYDTVISII